MPARYSQLNRTLAFAIWELVSVAIVFILFCAQAGNPEGTLLVQVFGGFLTLSTQNHWILLKNYLH